MLDQFGFHGSYNVTTSHGELIAEGGAGDFDHSQTTIFTISEGGHVSHSETTSSASVWEVSSQTPSMSPLPSSVPSVSAEPTVIPPSTSPTLTLTPTETCYWIVIAIVYDNYPKETSWELKINQTEREYLVLKSYSAADGDTVYTDSVCLRDEGNYTFAIYDEGADGICCDYGEGHYNITSSNGVLIAEGGEFDASEVVQFSVPYAQAQQPSQSPINWLNLFPG